MTALGLGQNVPTYVYIVRVWENDYNCKMNLYTDKLTLNADEADLLSKEYAYNTRLQGGVVHVYQYSLINGKSVKISFPEYPIDLGQAS